MPRDSRAEPSAPHATDFQLRPVGIDDWSAVRYVHGVAWRLLISPYLAPEEIAAAAAHLRSPEYTADLETLNLHAAWVQGELVGTAGWAPADDAGTAARIVAVYVRPLFTRLGIGRALVLDAEARARAAGFGSFSIRVTPHVVGFFECLGYAVSSHGVHFVMTEHGVPVTFMRKTDLPGSQALDAVPLLTRPDPQNAGNDPALAVAPSPASVGLRALRLRARSRSAAEET